MLKETVKFNDIFLLYFNNKINAAVQESKYEEMETGSVAIIKGRFIIYKSFRF